MLTRPIVIKLASILTLDDGAFVIGGQAFNLWAERYAAGDPRLAAYGPFTSKDIDYFGHVDAAQKLANALGGVLKIPSSDNVGTPNAALVQAEIDGEWIEIDFITHVLGVRADKLEKWAVELTAPIRAGEATGELTIPVMHPLHCYQSRVANVLKLGRTDDTAMRQFNAAPVVLEHYIDEQLRAGELREAQDTLAGLAHHLSKDPEGRAAHTRCEFDPQRILRRAASDPRLDTRFRAFNIAWMLIQVEAARLTRRFLP